MEYDSALKRRVILTRATTWMENITLSEASQTHNDSCCLLPFIWGTETYQIYRNRKENGGCQGLERGWDGSHCVLCVCVCVFFFPVAKIRCFRHSSKNWVSRKMTVVPSHHEYVDSFQLVVSMSEDLKMQVGFTVTTTVTKIQRVFIGHHYHLFWLADIIFIIFWGKQGFSNYDEGRGSERWTLLLKYGQPGQLGGPHFRSGTCRQF